MKTLFTLLFSLPPLLFSQEEEEEVITTTGNTNKKDEIIAISPCYPGGPQNMAIFIRDNFKYPEEARMYGEQGTIWVEFVVYSDGILRDIKVVKGVSRSLDAESIRVIEAMPKWKPGEQDGKKVNVRYTIPIKAAFNLSKGQKKRTKRKAEKERKNR